MNVRFLATLAALALPVAVFGQTGDGYQVRYFSNLNVGESYINIVNTGFQGGTETTGDICANIYVFDNTKPPGEEMVECCTCDTTPDGQYSARVKADLLANNLLAINTNSAVVKIIATKPLAAGPGFSACDAASNAFPPEAGLKAWATTLHLNTQNGVWQLTETPFAPSGPPTAGGVNSELAQLRAQCDFIQKHGSGFGTCAGCKLGGLAVSK